MTRSSISELPSFQMGNGSFSQGASRDMPFGCTPKIWKAENRKRLRRMEAGHGGCSSHLTESWQWVSARAENIISSQLMEARLTRSLASNPGIPSTVGPRTDELSLCTILWDYPSPSRVLIPSQEIEQLGSRLRSVIPRASIRFKASQSHPTKKLSSILTADDSQICTWLKD